MKKMSFNENGSKINPIKIEEKQDTDKANEEDNKSTCIDYATNIEGTSCGKIEEYSEELEKSKWKYAAFVLERLIFIVSIIFFTIAFVTIIFSSRNFYKLN
jgi:hypothetical protein